MKKLKLSFVDVEHKSVSGMLKWLSGIYALDVGSKDPDFVIHSCFGTDVLRFAGVRVAWLGENLQPNFNVSDYALGFGRMHYGDRYMRVPLYRWYLPEYESLFNPDRSVRLIDGRHELASKSRFCTATISNGSRGEFFERLFEALPTYRPVASGGRWRNNVGGAVREKLTFIRQGKFHIAFENSSTSGYITEKIMHAFAAHTIPIYWGAPDIGEDFNPKAYINCHQYDSVDAVMARVRELDCDDTAYTAMLEEPCFARGAEPESLRKQAIMEWLRHIFDQPRELAYRRNRQYWGARYESELSTAYFRPHIQTAKLAVRRFRKFVKRMRSQ